MPTVYRLVQLAPFDERGRCALRIDCVVTTDDGRFVSCHKWHHDDEDPRARAALYQTYGFATTFVPWADSVASVIVRSFDACVDLDER